MVDNSLQLLQKNLCAYSLAYVGGYYTVIPYHHPNPRQRHWAGNAHLLVRREGLAVTQPKCYYDFITFSNEDRIALPEEPDGTLSPRPGPKHPRLALPQVQRKA